MKQELFPIVRDYLKQVAISRTSKSVYTRDRAKNKAYRILAIMNAKAVKQALNAELGETQNG